MFVNCNTVVDSYMYIIIESHTSHQLVMRAVHMKEEVEKGERERAEEEKRKEVEEV